MLYAGGQEIQPPKSTRIEQRIHLAPNNRQVVAEQTGAEHVELAVRLPLR